MALDRINNFIAELKQESFKLDKKGNFQCVTDLADLDLKENSIEPDNSKTFIDAVLNPILRKQDEEQKELKAEAVSEDERTACNQAMATLQAEARKKREAFFLEKIKTKLPAFESQDDKAFFTIDATQKGQDDSTIGALINNYRTVFLPGGISTIGSSPKFTTGFSTQWNEEIKKKPVEAKSSAAASLSSAPTTSSPPVSQLPRTSHQVRPRPAAPPRPPQGGGDTKETLLDRRVYSSSDSSADPVRSGQRGRPALTVDTSSPPLPPKTADRKTTSSSTIAAAHTVPTASPTTPKATGIYPRAKATDAHPPSTLTPPPPPPSPSSPPPPSSLSSSSSASASPDSPEPASPAPATPLHDDDEEAKTLPDIQAENLVLVQKKIADLQKRHSDTIPQAKAKLSLEIAALNPRIQKLKDLRSIIKRNPKEEGDEGETLSDLETKQNEASNQNQALAISKKLIIKKLVELEHAKDMKGIEAALTDGQDQKGKTTFLRVGMEWADGYDYKPGQEKLDFKKDGKEINTNATAALTELAAKDYKSITASLTDSDSPEAKSIITSGHVELKAAILAAYKKDFSADAVKASVSRLKKASTIEAFNRELNSLGLQGKKPEHEALHKILESNREKQKIELKPGFKESALKNPEGGFGTAIRIEEKNIREYQRSRVLNAKKLQESYDNLSRLQSGVGSMLQTSSSYAGNHRLKQKEKDRYDRTAAYFKGELATVKALLKTTEELIKEEKVDNYEKKRAVKYGPAVDPEFKPELLDSEEKAIAAANEWIEDSKSQPIEHVVLAGNTQSSQGFVSEEVQKIYENKKVPLVKWEIPTKETSARVAALQTLKEAGEGDDKKPAIQGKTALFLSEKAMDILKKGKRTGGLLGLSIPCLDTMNTARKMLEAHLKLVGDKIPITLHIPSGTTASNENKKAYKALAEALKICCQFKGVPLPKGYGKKPTIDEQRELDRQVEAYEKETTKVNKADVSKATEKQMQDSLRQNTLKP